LPLNHLPGKNRQTMGRIGEVRLAPARPTRQPDGRRDDAAALSGQSTALYQDEGLEEGILKDAIRFELEPLAAPAIG
jgi:hypothetical protein